MHDWPAPVEIVNAGGIDGKRSVVNPTGTSSVVLLCPHASNYLPSQYGTLDVPPSELQRHIAWDIGAASVTRSLATLLNAVAFLGTCSRLLIDLNRPVESTSSIVTRSERTEIPANVGITAQERALRAARVFTPHHQAIAEHLAQRKAEGRRSVIVAIHSFTPTYDGVARVWHVGVLFVASKAFAHATIERLRAQDASLSVGANVPYTVEPDTDYGVLVHGDRLGNPALEFELRQDLVASAQDQQRWARTLADALAIDKV